MINLLSPNKKSEIRAARANVVLAHYSVAIVVLGVLISFIYGAGFWIVANDKIATETKIASEQSQSNAYATSQKQASDFQRNLRIAKQILGSETSYSTFLTTLASDLPSGAILTDISLGTLTPAQEKDGVTMGVRTASYEIALQTKTRLENSKLFENVNIVNIKRPEDISKLSGQESRYPYEVSYNVHLSKKVGAAQ